MKTYLTFIFVFGLTLSSIGQRTLFYNSKVFGRTDPTSWFIVDHGKVAAIGDGRTLPDDSRFDRAVNLESRTVLPGIVDSHIHFIDGGLGMIQVNFSTVHDGSSLARYISERKNQLLDGLFIGRDLSYEAIKDIASPIKFLDDQLGQTPAIIFLKSGHAAVVNTSAMNKLGFNRTTKIEDGEIQKAEDGEFTGVLLEGAAMEANRLIGAMFSQATIEKAILAIQERALAYGITTIGDNTFNPWYYKIYQQMQINGSLKVRVRARSYGRIAETDGLMKGLGQKHLGFIGGGVDFDRVKYHAIKYFEDMSLSVPDGHTDVVVPGGKVYLGLDEVRDIFAVHPSSVIAFHVQGKAGLNNILTALESGGKKHPRHVIDHAGYVSEREVQRIGELGLGVTLIGGQTFDYERLSRFYALHDPTFNPAELLDMRLKFVKTRAALTSDFPYGMDTTFEKYAHIDGLNPFPLMAANASGRYPDGSPIVGFENKTLSTEDAIRSYTENGAFVLGEENLFGKIDVGYEADFIVLKSEPRGAMDLYTTEVGTTYVHGEKVFELGQATVANTRLRKVSNKDYAVSPVIGYDPTLGMILGAAYFKFPLKVPGTYFDAQLQTLTSGKVNAMVNLTKFELRKNVNFGLSASYSNFFQYYFGEGNRTDAGNYSKLYADTYRVRPEFVFKSRAKIQWILFAEARGRREVKTTDENGQLIDRIVPDENRIAYGFTFRRDTRDNTFSTKKGVLYQLTTQVVPGANEQTFIQVQGEIRHFRYIGRPDLVLSSRIAAGYTFGSVDYLFNYSLGGPFALRGDYSNRFRGDKYYVGQLELRFPIYKRLSGAMFTDAGDVTSNEWLKPTVTYGGGIRFALNENIKLRLDYGKAKDQTGVFFTFSEAF